MQAILVSMGMVVLGAGVALVGTLAIKNEAITALGVLLIGAGVGGLGIPRPQDVSSESADKVV